MEWLFVNLLFRLSVSKFHNNIINHSLPFNSPAFRQKMLMPNLIKATNFCFPVYSNLYHNFNRYACINK